MIDKYYEKEIKALNRNRIKYLVIGGLAVNLYGLHRLTRDLDLMIDLSLPKDNLNKFVNTIDQLDYYTRVPKDKWPSLTAISFLCKKDEDKIIDVFLENPIDFNAAYKRRKVFKSGGFNISTVSLKDLLDLKNKADRLRDWIDIGAIKRMMELKKHEK